MISSIQAHRPLDGLTTFGTRSEADHYAEAGSLDELEAHLAEANANGLPVHFLGAGANTIAMSRVPGMTIRITIKGVEMSAAPNGDVLVKCGAGEVFDDIVARTLKAGIGGLENLSAIPGTVGGAVVQNIGAYGVELAERLSSVTVYDRAEKVVRVLTVEECDFSYRHSIMKTEAGRNFVVLSVTLRLPAVWTPVLGYKDLEAEIEARGLTAETVTAPVMSEIVRAVRARKLPDPAVIGNAGSFFTNPILPEAVAASLPEGAPRFGAGEGLVKTSAAWLIDHAGCSKGFHLPEAGDPPRASLSTKHVLALTNRGGASSADIEALARAVRERVYDAFGVTLVPEPVTVGITW